MGKTWMFRACKATFCAVQCLLNHRTRIDWCSHTFHFIHSTSFLSRSVRGSKQIVSTWNYAYRTSRLSEWVFDRRRKIEKMKRTTKCFHAIDQICVDFVNSWRFHYYYGHNEHKMYLCSIFITVSPYINQKSFNRNENYDKKREMERERKKRSLMMFIWVYGQRKSDGRKINWKKKNSKEQ